VSIGLLALLDDVIGLAKIAAVSMDDVLGQAAKAGAKAAGVVIDDAAVTPRYVVGFAAARELSIVRKIAIGSLKNKLLILLPAAIALSMFAPWAIMPLLMIGGAYLCYEGVERLKILGVLGTAAMIWVGGGIIVHGLESYGMSGIAGAIHRSADFGARALPAAPSVAEWLMAATGSGLVGLIIGAVLLPVTNHVITPVWRAACTRCY
jgi:uncharacterized protein